jgi:hypothetical protein
LENYNRDIQLVCMNILKDILCEVVYLKNIWDLSGLRTWQSSCTTTNFINKLYWNYYSLTHFFGYWHISLFFKIKKVYPTVSLTTGNDDSYRSGRVPRSCFVLFIFRLFVHLFFVIGKAICSFFSWDTFLKTIHPDIPLAYTLYYQF